MVSTDKKILEEGSSVRARMQFLGQVFDELHIIILGAKGSKQTYANITLYPLSRLAALRFAPPKVDIVTSQDPFETGVIARKLARKTGAKVSIQVHTDLFSHYFQTSSLKNRLRASMAPNVLRHADQIRVVSNRIRESIVQKVGIKREIISVLPVFIDVARLKGAPIKDNLHTMYPQFKKIILMASRLTKEKDIPTALLAFKNTLKQFPDAGLLIAGEGPELGHLKHQVHTLHLESSVVFESWANDLSSHYKTADLFLNTSLFEGYGMTLVEARLANLPVVSTDVGIASEILPADMISKVGDVLSLSENLNKALSGNISMAKPLSLLSKEEYLKEYKRILLL